MIACWPFLLNQLAPGVLTRDGFSLQLTEVVEGLNAELEEVEAQGNDIACLNQIWGTYSQKAAAAAAAAAASS